MDFSTIPQLDDHDFDNATLKNKECSIILFYADWCGHCVNFKPVYVQFYEKVPSLNIAAVNSEHENVIKAFNITGFPTLLKFKNGQKTGEITDRSLNGLIDSAMSLCDEDCKCSDKVSANMNSGSEYDESENEESEESDDDEYESESDEENEANVEDSEIAYMPNDNYEDIISDLLDNMKINYDEPFDIEEFLKRFKKNIPMDITPNIVEKVYEKKKKSMQELLENLRELEMSEADEANVNEFSEEIERSLKRHKARLPVGQRVFEPETPKLEELKTDMYMLLVMHIDRDSNGFVIRKANSLQQAFDIFNKIDPRRVRREEIPNNITDWNGYEEMLEENENTNRESVFHKIGGTVWSLSRIVFDDGAFLMVDH
jgi:thiol-disulfide isomerase/thioredoxin